MEPPRFSRRKIIKVMVLGWAGLVSACCLVKRQPTSLCLNSPELQDPHSALAIDVHTHVFNATDLQVKEFISRVAVDDNGALGRMARLFGSLMQSLGWDVAPSVQEELVILDQLGSDSCAGKNLSQELASVREMQYKKTREEIEARKTKMEAAIPMAFGQQQSALEHEISSANLALGEMPDTYEKFRMGERAPSAGDAVQPMQVGPRSALDFLVEFFQYRVSSVARYFNDYNESSDLKIDLMCPSMVDYDWWLAEGAETEKSPLQDQVSYYKELAVISGGRVHAFAPFDPFREAIHQKYKGTPQAGTMWSSLDLVKKAITEQGFIGVKLYPPMGFAALGNDSMDVWRDKRWLTDIAREPGFGELLDAAMRSLFAWCRVEDVPILAHTNASNSPDDDFLPLVGPEYWSIAMSEFKGLRINFGHFGGAGSKAFGSDRVKQFLNLMADPDRGRNAFADASYFTHLLEDRSVVKSGMRDLYESDEFGTIARSRLMYGSDWKMLLLEKHSASYLERFSQIISDLSSDGDNLRTDFFGANAARYLGLQKGEATRERLDQFYKDQNITLPVWMRKVDAIG